MCSNSLSKIGIKDLFSVLNIIIQDKSKSINCEATEICFELFQRVFSVYFKNEQIFNLDDEVETQLSAYLQLLISENKFSQDLFCELLFNELREIPLKLVAWLDENNIYFFTQYCTDNSPKNIATDFINLIESNSKREISYVFLKIIISAYNIGITNSSKLFTIKCRKILDEFLNTSLEEFENDKSTLMDILPIINELNNFLYGHLIQQLRKQIIQKILTYNDVVTLQDAFLLQEIWTLKNISDKNINTYYELIKSYKLEELLELITSISERNLNWKFALILISIYHKRNPNEYEEITTGTYFKQKKMFDHISSLINRRLQILFSDKLKTVITNDLKPSSELLTCIMLVRQVCYEVDSSELSYNEWYSNTFGPNTNLRTGSDPLAFNLLLATLTSVVNKEQIHVLRTHIERSIRTPSGCQSDMLVFKDVCRLQLSRIIQSKQIKIKKCSIPAVLLLDEGLNRFDCIWALKQPDICKTLLPYVLGNKKYERLEKMMLANGSIDQNDILTCKKLAVMSNESVVEYDEEEMLFE